MRGQAASRRQLMWMLTGACGGALLGVRPARAQGIEPTPPVAEAELCPAESFEDEASRQSLNYVEHSPYGAERDCRNCTFWLAGETSESCGGCTLITGAIDPLAYCDSWASA